MGYVQPEVIAEARKVDLFSYLQATDPNELVKCDGNEYCTRTHDSLKISNGKWFWWSRGIGGASALDYLVKVRGVDFVTAVEAVMGKAVEIPSFIAPEKKKVYDRVYVPRYTFALHDWLELYEKESVKPRTYRHYQDIICKRLVPSLGDYEMEELTAVVLQKYIVELSRSGNEKTGEGLSANTVNGIVIVLRSSLMMAYALGLTSEIHIDKIRRPKISEKPVESFTVAEQKQIEKAVLADRRDKMFGVVLCLYTGLRVGELLALEWSDIDFSKGELSVNKTCYDGRDENGRTCRIVDTPKTKSSKRVIPVAKQLIPLLKERKKRSLSKYVVGSGTAPISVRSYQRSFELLLKKLNISHHGFHALRHTFATRAIECGMDVKSLSEILGHKNPTITLNRYVHSFMEHKRDFVNRIGKML